MQSMLLGMVGAITLSGLALSGTTDQMKEVTSYSNCHRQTQTFVMQALDTRKVKNIAYNDRYAVELAKVALQCQGELPDLVDAKALPARIHDRAKQGDVKQAAAAQLAQEEAQMEKDIEFGK